MIWYGKSGLRVVSFHVESLGIDWVMIKERADGSLSTALARGLKKLADSIEVDGGRIFNGVRMPA